MFCTICFFLLLLISNRTLHGLHCYSNGTYGFSRANFQWTNFSEILANLYQPTSANLASCHVRLTVNYHTRSNNNYVVIQFLPLLNTSQANIEFGSTIRFLANEKQTVQSYFDYRCSSGNLCDKNFLNKWPRSILNSSDNSFHQNFLSLWRTPQICHDKVRTPACESYLCFTIYNELKNLSYGKSQCQEHWLSQPVNISIQTQSGRAYQHYQCKKNQCTGEIFYDSRLKSNASEAGNVQMKKQERDRLIFKHVLIIIAILLVIGTIAYCIQCRKYQQGYRLTKTQSV